MLAWVWKESDMADEQVGALDSGASSSPRASLRSEAEVTFSARTIVQRSNVPLVSGLEVEKTSSAGGRRVIL